MSTLHWQIPAICWIPVLAADVLNQKPWTPCRNVTSNFGFLRKPTESVGRMWLLLGLKSLFSPISAGAKKPDLKPGVSVRPQAERHSSRVGILLLKQSGLHIT